MSFFRQKNIRTYILCLNNYSLMMSFCLKLLCSDVIMSEKKSTFAARN